MTALVLEALQEAHPDLFASSAEHVWGARGATPPPFSGAQVMKNDGNDGLQSEAEEKAEAQDINNGVGGVVPPRPLPPPRRAPPGSIPSWHDGQLGGAMAARPPASHGARLLGRRPA